ncbi:MAG: flagellar hook-basal body complex protein, partial [Pseudomonadota bacterium]|nr:flagellar hook-basal body complex protein [Pseudomonadota bacterium]
VNATAINISADGVVAVNQPGSPAPVQVGALQLATFPNAAGLSAKGGNIYQETAASGTAATGVPGLNGVGTVSAGYVETSNVNVVEELVNMIETQRAYEINSKAISTTDQMLAKLSQM